MKKVPALRGNIHHEAILTINQNAFIDHLHLFEPFPAFQNIDRGTGLPTKFQGFMLVAEPQENNHGDGQGNYNLGTFQVS